VEKGWGGWGYGGEGRGAGVGEAAADAGPESFSAGRGTLEDQEGIGSTGAEGGEEPGEAAEPGVAGGEIEEGAEDFEGGGRARQRARGFRWGRFGRREVDGGSEGLEEGVVGDGGLPAAGGDFDKLALVIGEVEEDLAGDEGGTAVCDAEGYVDAPEIFDAALGFEEIEDGVEGVGGGDGVALGVDAKEEPVAKVRGADGEVAAGRDGDLNECLAVVGFEGKAVADEVDEALDGGRFEHEILSSFVLAGDHCEIGSRSAGFVEMIGNIVRKIW